MTTVRRSVEQTVSRLVRRTVRERAQLVGLPNARTDAFAALASLLDYTPPDLDALHVATLCAEALRYGFGCVVVPLGVVAACADYLGGSGVRVGVKIESLAELAAALHAGASEIEIAPTPETIAHDQQFAAWLGDLRGRGDSHFILKLDLTDPTLPLDLLLRTCARVGSLAVDVVTIPPALIAEIERVISPDMAIKVNGITTLAEARQALAEGAARLGTSHALALMPRL